MMYAKQSLGEDLAEHSYQFSCLAADRSAMSFATIPLQLEPADLHVTDALGQQDVPEYFQQPAKTITEEICVMRGPAEGKQAVLNELGQYEEVWRSESTSIPLGPIECWDVSTARLLTLEATRSS